MYPPLLYWLIFSAVHQRWGGARKTSTAKHLHELWIGVSLQTREKKFTIMFVSCERFRFLSCIYLFTQALIGLNLGPQPSSLVICDHRTVCARWKGPFSPGHILLHVSFAREICRSHTERFLATYEFKGSKWEQRLHSFFPLSWHLININVSFPLTTIILSRCLQLKDIESCLFSFDHESSSQIFEGHVNEKKKKSKKENVGHGWQNIMHGGEEAQIRLLNQTVSKCQNTT